MGITRRRFITSAIGGGAAVTLTPWTRLLGQGPTTQPGERLNVIWILADDLGFGDLSCYGSADIKTPNIDRIAAAGVKLEQFYVNPACSPTRAALLTGRYARRVGMPAVHMPGAKDPAKHFQSGGGVRPSEVLVSETLKAAGYATGCVGKWHIGVAPPYRPGANGFDEFFGHLWGKIDYFKHESYGERHDLWENDKEVRREGYSTDLFTERALKFMRDHAKGERPFFLYLPYNAPHYGDNYALQAPQEVIARVAKDPANPTKRELYAAMVTAMDDGIGKLLELLKELDLEKNTLLIFMSDNGGDPRHGGGNGPLRGQKGQVWEGGIRVPAMVRLPGVIKPGTTRSDVVSVMDMLSTTLSAVGVAALEGVWLDGQDVWAALKGGQVVGSRTLVWEYSGSQAIRRGDWKLVVSGKEQQLFDLAADLYEKNDLAEKHPERVKELADALADWQKDVRKQ